MNMIKSKRTVALAGALALGVSAGGAIAASKSSSASGNGFLARVAGHLGISTQKLQDATKAAAVDQVDADLKAGRITKAQADEMKARIKPEAFRSSSAAPIASATSATGARAASNAAGICPRRRAISA